MAKNILYDFKSLICTDPDCLQFAKKENEHSWWYIQIIDRKILDEYEGHEEDFAKAYENGAIVNSIDIRHAVNTYSTVSASIDLDDYKESVIERCINTFGYYYKLKADIELLKSSRSDSASFCTGVSTNGNMGWVDSRGRTFKEVFPK